MSSYSDTPNSKQPTTETNSTLLTESRSLNGCWTCRLRKKKCDEVHPACTLCTSLELQCYGYGPKPVWMDKGLLQREESTKVKRLVSDIRSRKRQQRSFQQTSHKSEEECLDNQDDAELVPFKLDSVPGSVEYYSKSQPRSTVHDIDSLQFPAPGYGDMLSSCFMFGVGIPRSLALNQPPMEDDNQYETLLTSESSNSISNSSSGFEILEEDSQSINLFSMQKTVAARDIGSPPVIEKTSTDAVNKHKAKLNKARSHKEDMLLMHYFDQVFYVQYPFYVPNEDEGRGWLLSILRQAKSAHHATLALSEYHKLSISPSNEIHKSSHNVPSLEGGHFDLAVREMQSHIRNLKPWTEDFDIDRALEALTCILQLLFWELFHGGVDNWRMHLNGAANIIGDLQQRAIQKSRDDAATEFLLGSFISLDIVSCASTRSAPFLKLDHRAVLDKKEVNLTKVIGCENWVLVMILEISILDTWKKHAESTHTLSTIELVKRGEQIESFLRDKLDHLERQSSMDIRVQATRIFALSALTYLYVVVSGPYPELPEIRRSVSQTICAFGSLPKATLLQNLVWPFCVTGCLALDEQQVIFRNLLACAKNSPNVSGTCVEALKIMEQCWKERKESNRNIDWVTAMDRLGYSVLLW